MTKKKNPKGTPFLLGYTRCQWDGGAPDASWIPVC